jgi:hypothetical protein
MGKFLHKHNTDNVHARAVIVGLVNLLNSRIQFENVLSDSDVDTVTVPFFYSMTGDERFLQDFFLEWNDCVHPKIADGNYDVIPRGIVTLTSNTINPSMMTHRFVRGTYTKEVEGQLQTFNSFINPIPLSMNFDVAIETDTNLDAFKIQQTIIETFYKTQVYSVGFKGFRVPCQVGFPEDYALEKTFEFTYQTDAKIIIKFTLAVETYLPVTDPTTTRKNSNRISTSGGPGFGIDLTEETNKVNFTFTQPTPNGVFFSGSILPISWTNIGSVIRTNLYYRLAGTGQDWVMFARSIENSGYYDWKVPFFNYEGTPIQNDPVKVIVNSSTGKEAKLRAIINPLGEVEKIIIFDGGYGYSNTDTIQVSPLILPPPGYPPFVSPEITAQVSGGKIVGYQILNPGSGFPSSSNTLIELKIENDIDENVYQVYEKVQSFFGDTDPFFDPFGPGIKQIRNLNPSVAELIGMGVDPIGFVTGPGVETGSKIISVDVINNLLNISRDVTGFIQDGEYTLEPKVAIFEIQ